MKKILLFVAMAFLIGTSFSQSVTTSVASGSFEQVSTTIEQHAVDGVLVAYPNPVINVVTIESSTFLESVVIVNMIGQELERRVVNGNSTTVDMSTYKKGIYLIATKNKTIRVIKQ